MFLPAEFLLITAVIGLYIYDSMILLYRNEGILSPSFKNVWGVYFGAERFQIRGKELFVPNIFFPHRPLYRLSWSDKGVPLADAWVAPKRAFPALVPWVWGMEIALFMLLPLGLFSRFGDLMIVAMLLVFYGSATIALVWIWRNRAHLQCSSRRFAGLAFESLTCPPFALNLIRHLSLGMTINEDLVCVSRHLQSPDEWAATQVRFLARIEDEIAWSEENSQQYQRLLAHRQRLSQEGAPCPEQKS